MVVLPRPRIILAIVAAVTLFGGLGSLVAISWLDRDATLAEASDRLHLSSRLSESHLRALLQSGQEALARIGDHLGHEHNPAIRRGWLAAVVADTPYITAVRIHGPDGEAILTTDSPPPLTETERADIATALAQPGRTVIGTAPALDTAVSPVDIILSRTYGDDAAPARGVVRIVVPMSYFMELYQGLQPPPGAVFAVVRLDGQMIARYPIPAVPLPRLDTSIHPFTTFAGTAEGMYRAVSVVDGLDRLASYRVLPDLDLVVTAGLLVDTVFHGWRVRTQNAAALVAVALLLVLGLTAVADESMRHESRLLRSVKQKADELALALADKDVLFQEVHHRVKNNLQVISSLLTMQSLHVQDESARNILKDALDRIHSMGLVHQTLYEHNLAANVDLGIYFGRLAEALAGSYGTGKGGVTVQVEASGTLELERAVPLGMLANEVLSNALKHAFADGRHGTVEVSLSCDDGWWRLAVRDDGIGIPDQPGRGIGFGLIRALTRQLGGSVNVATRPEGGTIVSAEFPA